ncbi:MAG: hypothetical protein HOO86_03775 [Bacteroidales bacterium]|nr:hypothetical protein [Bacteroidales bacterium]
MEIIELVSKKDYREFVKLPFRLYKGNPNWVPPMINDELKMLQSATNPAFDFCDAKFWIVKQGGIVVGRIGAIVNKLYNAFRNENMGRFTRFECINDREVAEKLFFAAEEWLKDQGMSGVYGPLGFSNLDLQGMLIEGFDHLASIASVYHQPYYQGIVESFGYEKEIDWIEFRLTVEGAALEKGIRGAEIVRKRHNIEVMHFNTTKELTPYAPKLFEILNDAFDVLPFVAPMDEKMINFYSGKYMPVLNPRFVKMARMNGEIIGFAVGLPSLSVAMQKSGGKLFPFGLFHILKAKKGNSGDTMDQMLTGIKKEYHATGAIVLLQAELQAEMVAHHLKYIETTGIFETNAKVIANWKNFEHIQHKRRRCFKKLFV